MEIWLAQYLCPQGHAIAARPYDPAEQSVAEVEGVLLAQMHTLGLQPWCGLCGSRDLRFDHARTRFTDWTTACAFSVSATWPATLAATAQLRRSDDPTEDRDSQRPGRQE
jgi:hypothetical protein